MSGDEKLPFNRKQPPKEPDSRWAGVCLTGRVKLKRRERGVLLIKPTVMIATPHNNNNNMMRPEDRLQEKERHILITCGSVLEEEKKSIMGVSHQSRLIAT